jgi:L-lactate dehydrogenase complex protein LldG
MAREHILHKVRTALGRSAGQAPAPVPAVRLTIPEMNVDERVSSFCRALEILAGTPHVASSKEDARAYVEKLLDGRAAVASNSQFLKECGIADLPNVRTGFDDRDSLRAACATAPVGITSATYGLADTGTLVMIASREEPRLISLLPPVHVAILPRERLLTSIDELLAFVPLPSEEASSMVLITGPSRTADIEQILVRGVHGPGQIHVIIV